MASPTKVFLDTDVVLDHLADRQPFAEYAHRLFGLAEIGELTLFVSALSFSNLYYILRKVSDHATALQLLTQLNQLVQVCTVAKNEIERALNSDFRDFEDGIQHSCAVREGGIEVIVTRNKRDYTASEILVLNPGEFFTRRGS